MADQSPALLSGGSELPDGLDEGDDESEAGIGKRKGENPREGTGADSGAGNGLCDRTGELHKVQGLLLNPWEVFFNLHLLNSTLFGFSFIRVFNNRV